MSIFNAPMMTREQVQAANDRPLPRALYLVAAALAAVGLLAFIVGLVIGQERVWLALHYNWLFWTSLSSAGVAFAAVQRITTARWSRTIVRFLEGFVAFLPVAFLLLLVIVLVGKNWVFPWTHEHAPQPERELYLDPLFFTVRVLATFAILVGLSLAFVWASVRLDVGVAAERGAKWARGLRERMRRGFGDERRELFTTHSRMGVLAVWLALAFGFGWSVLAFDLSMTLDLHFFSALYGWWFFMGGWLAAILLWSLLVMWWRGFLGSTLITEGHFHDLGKLSFAFAAFWGYLTFGQYLIIWYGNLTEETHYFRLRLIEPWQWLTVWIVFLTFLIPFFGLLSRAAKVFLPTFAVFAISGLIGVWLLRYIEVYPSLLGVTEDVPFGIWEIGVTAFFAGLWGLCYLAFMDAFPRMRIVYSTSRWRDEVQIPYDPKTMQPLPAHE